MIVTASNEEVISMANAAMLSEWTQQTGLVLLTKRLIETGSKESNDDSYGRGRL